MRSSPFLDLRSGTTEETCAATVTQRTRVRTHMRTHTRTHTHVHTHTHRRIENEEVGHLQEEISVTRQRYRTNMGLSAAAVPDLGGVAQLALMYFHAAFKKGGKTVYAEVETKGFLKFEIRNKTSYFQTGIYL